MTAISNEATRSCVVIPVVNVPVELGDVRKAFDPVAHQSGLPLHSTVLFPFAKPKDLGPTLLDLLVHTASRVAPIDVVLTSVAQFDQVVYLAVEPTGLAAAVLNDLRSPFPEYLPYEGRFSDPLPHVSVGFTKRSGELPLMAAAIRRRLSPVLPIRCRFDRLVLAVETRPFDWKVEAEIMLGR